MRKTWTTWWTGCPRPRRHDQRGASAWTRCQGPGRASILSAAQCTRSTDVHRHESLQGRPRVRSRLRAGMDLPRHASERRPGLRRLPSAARSRARRSRAVFVAHAVAQPNGFRGMDAVRGVPPGAPRMPARTGRCTSAIRNSKGSTSSRRSSPAARKRNEAAGAAPARTRVECGACLGDAAATLNQGPETCPSFAASCATT